MPIVHSIFVVPSDIGVATISDPSLETLKYLGTMSVTTALLAILSTIVLPMPIYISSILLDGELVSKYIEFLLATAFMTSRAFARLVPLKPSVIATENTPVLLKAFKLAAAASASDFSASLVALPEPSRVMP